ncbi:MAG: tRNA uridine-5-carboxymethylaminomethyl(34) synthesis GTPase MnmE [Parvularculaceae bacterium]|nr:MAG: tRNA uridine-5-carboxymethylaminomethyl(34) synthesis GTPase MnmE [Parvularculaceae bacterium]
METIFAKASGAGKAGIAVIRLSGPLTVSIAESLCARPLSARIATHTVIRESRGAAILDVGLAVLFPGPASFTGEDVLELHVHGSRSVENDLYHALQKHGARPAEAGEFTKRALLNGKMDLAEVEGLADLIDAETSAQRRQALAQTNGRLSKRAEAWRQQLTLILAALEADIDFPDEEDVPAAVAQGAVDLIHGLIGDLNLALVHGGRAMRLREGVTVAIIGAPNAGKSSLLNCLVDDDRAIVSAQAGTTRDIVEARLDLAGVPVVFQDTAGIRDSVGDAIEDEGVRRSIKAADEADLRVVVVDPFGGSDKAPRGTRYDVPRETRDLLGEGDLVIWTKADLGSEPPPPLSSDKWLGRAVSSKTRAGIDDLLEDVTAFVETATQAAGDGPLTRARHLAAVENASQSLSQSLELIAMGPELAAEEVRLAARALGRITGAVDVEDVLGEIFSSFCIGK